MTVKGHSPPGLREVIPHLPPRDDRGRPIRPRPLQGLLTSGQSGPQQRHETASGRYPAAIRPQKIRFPLEQDDKKSRQFRE